MIGTESAAGIRTFLYEALPARVVFGSGTIAQLASEAARLGMERALVLATPGRPGRAADLAALLGGRSAGVFAGAVMHTPVSATEAALRAVAEAGADGLVAFGGGSAIGLGKALALRIDLPQIAIPTTYAGSEMTPILGESKEGVKTTQRSLKVLPETVIYDVDLTLGLPPRVSATSGINAIAHAVEALYAQEQNPVTALMAEQGIAALSRALPVIVRDPADRAARSDALYGAWLCGVCLGTVGMALHHKLCHTLGGSFGLPHAETHTVILPHAAAYNAPAAPDAMARVACALGAGEAARGLYDLAGRLGAPRSLRELGMEEGGVERAADLAVERPYWNPRPVERDAIRDLIARAWAGLPPRTSPDP
ncbi:MAG TPA: maleylacetate reductase [Microvirga sp.]|nr:maleylacetate reductase [Microvirga sp.]